jgi:hypothetical protein
MIDPSVELKSLLSFLGDLMYLLLFLVLLLEKEGFLSKVKNMGEVIFKGRGTHTLILSYSHTLILSYSHTLILSYPHTLILSHSHTHTHTHTHSS